MVAKDRSLLGPQPFQFSAAVFNPFQSRLQPLLHLARVVWLYGGGKVLSSSFTTALVICGAEVLEGGVNGGGVGPQLRTVIRLVLFFCYENPAKDSLPSLGHCSS